MALTAMKDDAGAKPMGVIIQLPESPLMRQRRRRQRWLRLGFVAVLLLIGVARLLTR